MQSVIFYISACIGWPGWKADLKLLLKEVTRWMVAGRSTIIFTNLEISLQSYRLLVSFYWSFYPKIDDNLIKNRTEKLRNCLHNNIAIWFLGKQSYRIAHYLSDAIYKLDNILVRKQGESHWCYIKMNSYWGSHKIISSSNLQFLCADQLYISTTCTDQLCHPIYTPVGPYIDALGVNG